jgi:hypothetical protein
MFYGSEEKMIEYNLSALPNLVSSECNILWPKCGEHANMAVNMKHQLLQHKRVIRL